MKSADGSWIIVVLSGAFAGALMIPVWADGVCAANNQETTGVCLREWMQAIGAFLIPILALIVAAYFSRKSTIKQELETVYTTISNTSEELSIIWRLAEPLSIAQSISNNKSAIGAPLLDFFIEKTQLCKTKLSETNDDLSNYVRLPIDRNRETIASSLMASIRQLLMDLVEVENALITSKITGSIRTEIPNLLTEINRKSGHIAERTRDYNVYLSQSLWKNKEIYTNLAESINAKISI